MTISIMIWLATMCCTHGVAAKFTPNAWGLRFYKKSTDLLWLVYLAPFTVITLYEITFMKGSKTIRKDVTIAAEVMIIKKIDETVSCLLILSLLMACTRVVEKQVWLWYNTLMSI